MKLELNQWESEFFGRQIYRVSELSPPSKGEDFPAESLVQAKVAVSDFSQITFLQQQHFQLVETALQFSLELVNYSADRTACECRLATEQDLPALKRWIGTAFPTSRFRSPYFSLAENQRFYRAWIDNAVKGQFDDLCLIKETQGEQQGAVSLRWHENSVRVGLLAVAPDYQRQGVGTALLRSALKVIQRQADQGRQADRLVIATQLSNHSAIQLYQSVGASLSDCHYWFYRQT